MGVGGRVRAGGRAGARARVCVSTVGHGFRCSLGAGRMGTRFSVELSEAIGTSGSGQGWRKDLANGDVAIVKSLCNSYRLSLCLRFLASFPVCAAYPLGPSTY